MSAGEAALAAVKARAELVCDRVTLEATIARIGAEVTVALGNQRAVFLTVMNGGMFFASALAFAIDGDLEFDYVHATRYRGMTEGADLRWVHRPVTPLASRTVLLADDILDEGYTLAALRAYCNAEGAKRVLIAVLCEKRHDRRVPGLRADFVGVRLPDRYLFGYGLDYQGRGRNLPGIYALAEDTECPA